jgi:DNA invertase Pin-like site-specific DNA recombinase
MLNDTSKLRREHLDRLAAVYVRQSSATQVRENTESTARQYALADDAQRLGWEASTVLVLDGDLGLSGRTAAGRSAFKELVSRVCTGEVGAVFGLEVSRFARSSADLQRLLEFCSITDTLVIDADGTYDLKNFNDRLLLGLKSTMSEAELHLLAGRLQESKRVAAQRGELRVRLPVGYIYDADGHIGLDPDEAVRAVVAEVFSAFTRTGSAFGVVQGFHDLRRSPETPGVCSSEVTHRW